MSFLRDTMDMTPTEPRPEGSFRFTCLRGVDEYAEPVQVEYVDTFKELEIAVEEISKQGPLLTCGIETVSMAELVGRPYTHANQVVWGCGNNQDSIRQLTQ